MAKAKAWQSSDGKKLLDRAIRKGQVTQNMTKDQIFNLYHPQFEECGKTPAEAYRLFDGRLASAFLRATEDRNRAEEDLAALRHDRATHPFPQLDAKGRPQWEGSLAQISMRQDVKNGVLHGMTQSQIRMSRPEYQIFDAETIGQHKSQEERKQKWFANRKDRIKSIPPSYP